MNDSMATQSGKVIAYDYNELVYCRSCLVDVFVQGEYDLVTPLTASDLMPENDNPCAGCNCYLTPEY